MRRGGFCSCLMMAQRGLGSFSFEAGCWQLGFNSSWRTRLWTGYHITGCLGHSEFQTLQGGGSHARAKRAETWAQVEWSG